MTKIASTLRPPVLFRSRQPKRSRKRRPDLELEALEARWQPAVIDFSNIDGETKYEIHFVGSGVDRTLSDSSSYHPESHVSGVGLYQGDPGQISIGARFDDGVFQRFDGSHAWMIGSASIQF